MKTLHAQICEHVRNLLASGKVGKSGKLPTDSQLMRQFNTSRATVVKAMRDLEQEGLISRRQGSGSFVNTPANLDNTAVAVMVAGLGEARYLEPICKEIADGCHKKNMTLIWGATGAINPVDSESEIDAVCNRCLEQKVRGVFYAPNELDPDAKTNTNLKLAQRFTKSGVAVVLLDCGLGMFPEELKYDYVGIDSFQAGFLQTSHLIRQGCRRIFYITKPGALTSKASRIAGYRYALDASNIPFREEWACSGNAEELEFTKRILEGNPDGLVCFNDSVAVKTLRNMLELGVAVPDRIKIVGLDNDDNTQFLPIPLTTFRQPCREIGDQAVELMIQRLQNPSRPPRAVVFAPEMVKRKSA